MLEEQNKAIVNQISHLIESDPILKQKQEVIKTIPGIRDIVSFELLILFPELGTLDPRKKNRLLDLLQEPMIVVNIRAIEDVAMEELKKKPILFLAAMAARNSKSLLKDFDEKLIAKRKKKMVALTALMRKILVIANSKLKELHITSLV